MNFGLESFVFQPLVMQLVFSVALVWVILAIAVNGTLVMVHFVLHGVELLG